MNERPNPPDKITILSKDPLMQRFLAWIDEKNLETGTFIKNPEEIFPRGTSQVRVASEDQSDQVAISRMHLVNWINKVLVPEYQLSRELTEQTVQKLMSNVPPIQSYPKAFLTVDSSRILVNTDKQHFPQPVAETRHSKTFIRVEDAVELLHRAEALLKRRQEQKISNENPFRRTRG